MNEIVELQKEFCIMCEQINGKKDVDTCFKCKWHKLFNKVKNNAKV